MKKCIFSAITDALTMLIVITIAARTGAIRAQAPQEYEHVDYVSNITLAE